MGEQDDGRVDDGRVDVGREVLLKAEKESRLVSASIRSADVTKLGQECHDVLTAGADMLHLDFFDGKFVPTITFGPEMAVTLRRALGSDVIFDCHLCACDPAAWVEKLSEAKVDHFTFQYEAVSSYDGRSKLLSSVRRCGMKAGLALAPHTDVESIRKHCHELDIVLIMTSSPGVSALPMQAGCLQKLSVLKKWKVQGILDAKVIVDGDLNLSNIHLIGDEADIVVAGSSIFGSRSATMDHEGQICAMKKSIQRLRSIATPIRWQDLPVNHVPTFIDGQAVAKAAKQLREMPPLIKEASIPALKTTIMLAGRGKKFLLFAGDCVVDPELQSTDGGSTIALVTLLQDLSTELGKKIPSKVVDIACVASQFGGSNINRPDWDKNAFLPDASLAVSGQEFSTTAFKFLVKHKKDPVTAHEAVVLWIEDALTVPSTVNPGKCFNHSAHIIWVSNLTRQLENGHLQYLSQLVNPIGVMLDAETQGSDVLAIVQKLNPQNEGGKIILMPHFGKTVNIKSVVADWVKALASVRLTVTWVSDPMRGYSAVAPLGGHSNQKVRLVPDVKAETIAFTKALIDIGENLGGFMIEAIGTQGASECVYDLDKFLPRPESCRMLCNPRMNRDQALDFTFCLGDFIKENTSLNAALILAKSGSIGFPGKNMKTLNGQTLVAKAVGDAIAEGCFDGGVWVSTNDPAIAREGLSVGARVIMRSDELAKNERFPDAVHHALRKMDTNPLTITILQCVQPYREKGLMARMCKELLDHKVADSVVTVSPGPGRVEWLVRDCESEFDSAIRRSGLESFQVQPLQAPWKLPGDSKGFAPQPLLDIMSLGRSSNLWEIDNAVVCFWRRNLMGHGAITPITPWPYLGSSILGVCQNVSNGHILCDINEPGDYDWARFVSEYNVWRKHDIMSQHDGEDVAMYSDTMDDMGVQGRIISKLKWNKEGVRFCGRTRTLLLEEGEFDDENVRAGLGFVESLSHGDVLIIKGSKKYAYFGELMSRLSMRAGLSGVIVDGATRDTAWTTTRECTIPVGSFSITPVDIRGRGRMKEVDVPIDISTDDSPSSPQLKVFPGDFVFADRDGVAIVPTEIESSVKVAVQKMVQKEVEIKLRISKNEAISNILDCHGDF